MCLPRMRTAEGVLQQLQADDPGTQMTLCSIRKIIRRGHLCCKPAVYSSAGGRNLSRFLRKGIAEAANA